MSEAATGRIRILMNTEDNTKTLYNQVIPATTVFNLKADTVNWMMGNEKNSYDSYLARFKSQDQVRSISP